MSPDLRATYRVQPTADFGLNAGNSNRAVTVTLLSEDWPYDANALVPTKAVAT